MTEPNARAMVQLWAEMEPVKVYEPRPKQQTRREAQAEKRKSSRGSDLFDRFKRRYGILLIAAAAFTIYTIILSACVEASTEKRVWAEAEVKYAGQLEAYKAEQAYEAQKEHWLSGNASREAFLNQEIDAAAHFIAEEANETMKGTKLGVAIARLMAGGYGETLQEVIDQPDQWMNYSGTDNKITQADRDFAEKIVRDYYENGIIPDGLTEDIQWLTWSPGDYLARNNWNAATATKTWRWHG